MSEGETLKLLAQDEADLQIVAAVLQDAIAPVAEMRFLKAEKNFVMVVHRFCWDRVKEGQSEPCYERISAAIDIEGVEAAQYLGFDPESPSLMLDMLTITLQEGFLHVLFAGGAQLRLKLGVWRLRLRDFGESWPTPHMPRHAT